MDKSAEESSAAYSFPAMGRKKDMFARYDYAGCQRYHAYKARRARYAADDCCVRGADGAAAECLRHFDEDDDHAADYYAAFDIFHAVLQECLPPPLCRAKVAERGASA